MDAQSAAKLPFNFKIIPVDSNGIPNDIPFIAMFNPDSFAVAETTEWNNENPAGNTGVDPRYQKIAPRTFSVELTIDGTGVNTNGVKIPVPLQILLFRKATANVNGTDHRPSYLLVQYGTFICTCVLSSSTVTYTMFDFLGLPIRAKITASFTERTPSGLSNILNMLSSPDLTHRKTVMEGDLLPNLTFQIYKNQQYYIQVARANKLKNFRKLKAGSELVFPPISKK